MTDADLPSIAALDIAAFRGPAGWIEWNGRNYAEYGFGRWVVESPSGEFIGDCGLTMQEVEGEWFVEIGWHVRADLRRRGYAAEAARAVLDTALASGIDSVIAIIAPDNAASQAVAAKVGMTLQRETSKGGERVLIFATGPPPRCRDTITS